LRRGHRHDYRRKRFNKDLRAGYFSSISHFGDLGKSTYVVFAPGY
jgi:hypothetical protein